MLEEPYYRQALALTGRSMAAFNMRGSFLPPHRLATHADTKGGAISGGARCPTRTRYASTSLAASSGFGGGEGQPRAGLVEASQLEQAGFELTFKGREIMVEVRRRNSPKSVLVVPTWYPNFAQHADNRADQP